MKLLTLICAGLLLLAITPMPIGYYRFLRLTITIGAVIIVLFEYKKNRSNFWVIIFALIAILYNPIFPVYLYKKGIWLPWNIISAAAFIIFRVKLNKK